MKAYLYFYILSFLLMSCSNNEDPAYKVSELADGKWLSVGSSISPEVEELQELTDYDINEIIPVETPSTIEINFKDEEVDTFEGPIMINGEIIYTYFESWEDYSNNKQATIARQYFFWNELEGVINPYAGFDLLPSIRIIDVSDQNLIIQQCLLGCFDYLHYERID